MAKLSDSIATAGMNSGGRVIAKMMKVSEIKDDPEIASIFSINSELLGTITRSMMDNGYDNSQPIVIWKYQNIVVDGRTRLQAAKEAGLKHIPVEEKIFQSIENAKQYTYKRQAERRNLTQAEIFAAANMIQKKTAYDGNGRAIDSLAKDIGVSASTLKHARAVAAQAEPEIIEQVKNNEISINKAYQEVKEKEKAAKPKIHEYFRIKIHIENISIGKSNENIKNLFEKFHFDLSDLQSRNEITASLFTDVLTAIKPIAGFDFPAVNDTSTSGESNNGQ